MARDSFVVELNKQARFAQEDWFVIWIPSGGTSKPVTQFRKKQPAIDKARGLAKHPDNRPSELVIKDKEGKVSERRRYDN